MDFATLNALIEKANATVKYSDEELLDMDMYHAELALSEQGTSSLKQFADEVEADCLETEEDFTAAFNDSSDADYQAQLDEERRQDYALDLQDFLIEIDWL